MPVTEGGSRTPGFAVAFREPPPAREQFEPRAEPAPDPPYPGDYAVPGLMWPGFALPGEPLAGFQGEWLFTGLYTCSYPQHVDALTEQMLTAQPGGAYFIRTIGDPGVTEPPGDGRWIRSPL